ncbi:hypothetical protein AKJ09_10421 [Labilithrix luteola]|uniref:Peptidase C1A papain C-terminal domain-containing protein n=1 Tax=Labilithrix luteola TaxID=1391654 RepID=A0A0K1QDG6_9BACT|nr:hypothetical protein [Labilithrix luteola]AKV03758.1 hypothetical protein AKJ09_10421 [Labilithrix luteola]
MSLDWTKKTRWLSFVSLLALATGATIGCAAESSSDEPATDDGTSVSTDDITQVDQSKVKRQSIGNCWLYATTSWLEALNKGATDVEQNTSESWLTYWHWYEQIANGRAGSEISTGGSYGTAADLIARYGVTLEKDFIASEAESEMSNRQSTALNAVNAALKSGALKDPTARRDKALVRKELDKAWGLDASVSARMDAVFGKAVTRTLDKSTYAQNAAKTNKIIPAKDFPARLKDTTTGQFVKATLAEAIGKSGGGWWAQREGKYAFNEVNYPRDAASRRAFWKRVQKALHDEVPVITSWKVDFNALSSSTSHFSLEELQRRGPGRQGGHMTVMHDYQADVPGFGLLKAGEQATPEQMNAALADSTKISFVRVKNSWGGVRPDRWSDAAIPGYHDLDLAYLDGPIKECSENASGETDTHNCPNDVTPLWDVVLPAGY